MYASSEVNSTRVASRLRLVNEFTKAPPEGGAHIFKRFEYLLTHSSEGDLY